MPLTRYQIRSEHTLADPELYRAADKDDPEALLEGVAMAGLVGVLRQLGDLAEFAAEIFHDLHEEVMTTATRGNGLMTRVQQLEADFPSIEKAILSQTDHSVLFHNKGVDWHPNQRMDQNLITGTDLPRFVMDSYEECRGPPRLFLLDKFDTAGAGACLKRYTDPSFFKAETLSSGLKKSELQRDKKIRKTKKKPSRWRNGATPEVVPASHSKLHQLLLEERVQNGTNVPARHIKLKKRQLPGSSFDLKNGKSYMEKFFEISSPEKKEINEIAGGAPPSEPIDDNTCDLVQEIVEISTIFPNKKQSRRKRISFSCPYTQESDHNVPMDDLAEAAPVTEAMEAELAAGVDKFTAQDVVFEKDFTLLGDSKKAGSIDGYHSDDVTSEVDNFVDALPTMESEIDPDSECSSKHNLTSSCVEKHGTDSDANEEHDVVQPQFSDSQSIGNSTFDDSSGKERYSHSDTLSSFAENIAPDFDGTVPCSVAEDSGSLNQPPLSEVNSTESLELVKFNFTNVEEVAAIPRYRSDQGEASCSSCLTDFDPGILHLNHGGTLEEVSSDHNLIDINKNGENLDAMLVTSHVSLITSKTNEVLIHPLDEHINADDMSNSQHILQQKSNVSSEVCQVKHVDVTDNFVNGPSLTDFHTEGQLQTLPSPNRETCLEMESKFPDKLAGRIVSDPFVAEPNSMDSEVDMALLGRSNSGSLAPLEDHNTSSTSEASLHPENLFASVDTEADMASRDYMEHTATAEDTRQCAPYSEQHLSQFRHDFLQIELNTSEATSGIEANRECLPSSSLDQENGLSTVNVDRLKNNDFPLLDTFDNPSDFVLDYASDTIKVIANAPSAIHDDGLGNSGGPLEEQFHYPSDSVLQNNASDTVKEAAAIAQSSSHDEFGDVANDVAFTSDLVSSPPWNSRNSQDLLFNSGEYPNDDLEADPGRSSVSLSGCKTQREVMQLGVAANSSFSSSSGTSDDNLNFEDEDTADPAMTEEMVPLEHVDQVVESSPTRTNSQLVTDIQHYPLESNLELQWDQPDLDYLQEYKLNDQLQHVHPLVHLDQENCFGVHLNDFPEQSPASHMLVQSAGQKPEGFENLTNGSETMFPSFQPLPEASQVNLEEAPPLPPLPPVQWRRLAKLLQAQNRLEHETESHGLGSHSQLFSSKIDDEHASVGLSSPGGEASKSQNLDLPSSSLQEEEEVKPNHVFGYSVERSVLSSGITLQMPIMVNSDDGQHDIHRLEESEPLNEMSPSTNSLQNGFQLLEGETVQSLSPEAQLSEGGSPEHYPSSSQGKPIEHLHREESHMGLQDTRHHDTFQSSERDILNPPEKVSPLPTTEAGQSQDSQQVPTTEVGQSQEPPQAPITEAEQNQEPPHTPITEAVNSLDSPQLPTTNSGQSLDSQQALQSTDLETEHSIESPLPHVPVQPNEKPLRKIPRPRDPLIEAVAAHDKSKLKKVAERVVRAQVEEKADNRDSLLEQIRAKSFSLKPAAMTRPSIQGPKTNLKVAAILEKANAIRQALAGSDEDDDADSWSSDS